MRRNRNERPTLIREREKINRMSLSCTASLEQLIALDIELKRSVKLQPFRTIQIPSTGQVIIFLGHRVCHVTDGIELKIEHGSRDIPRELRRGIIEIQCID